MIDIRRQNSKYNAGKPETPEAKAKRKEEEDYINNLKSHREELAKEMVGLFGNYRDVNTGIIFPKFSHTIIGSVLKCGKGYVSKLMRHPRPLKMGKKNQPQKEAFLIMIDRVKVLKFHWKEPPLEIVEEILNQRNLEENNSLENTEELEKIKKLKRRLTKEKLRSKKLKKAIKKQQKKHHKSIQSFQSILENLTNNKTEK